MARLRHPFRSPLLSATALSAAFGLLGCVGTIDGSGNSGNGPGDEPGDPGSSPNPAVGTKPPLPGAPPGTGAPGTPGTGTPTTPADPNAAGPAPLRRLDQREYNNTVRDLLGDTTRPADRFPSDKEPEHNFRHPGIVSSQDYSTIQDAAEVLGALAEKNVATLAPCAQMGAGEEACARTFATGFGLRAYRRPLVTAEVDSLMQLYKEVRGAPLSLTYAGGIRVMVQGMLQSPSFLYHWESGPAAPSVEGKVVKNDHYENASRISYFIWGSMPDADLFAAAAAKKLGTAAEIESHAKRMLADPRAKDTVADFFESWLGLDQVTERPKDPKLYPEFNDALKAAMAAEARSFVNNVVFDGDGKLETMLSATFSFVNGPLAALYGMKSGAPTGADLKQMDLTAGERAGLLTQSAFLTVTGATDGSHPVKRGKKVYERLLCGILPPPPGDVPPPKPASAGGTTRERFNEHGSEACARACHQLIDPLGFSFENYDGIGKYRTTDNGGQVDATGKFEIDGKPVSYNNARELAIILSTSDTVRSCFATQWARYAWKRMETEGDRASLDAIWGVFGKNNFTVKDLMLGVTTARSSRYRAPSEGEVLQ